MELYPKNQRAWIVPTVLVAATALASAFIGRYVDMIEDQLLRDVGLLVLALFLPCVLALASGWSMYQWLSPKHRRGVVKRENWLDWGEGERVKVQIKKAVSDPDCLKVGEVHYKQGEEPWILRERAQVWAKGDICVIMESRDANA